MRLFLLVSSTLFIAVPTLAANCISSLVPGSVKVGWTAYKFTEKKAVSGQILGAEVSTSKTAASDQELLASTSFVIDPQKVDSGDPGRDQTLKTTFFKALKTPLIKGRVSSADKTSAQVTLEMNGVSKVIPMKLKKDKNKWTAEGQIDVLDFMMQKSYDELHKACEILHKGADGVSKTWTTVGLTISADVAQTCK